MIVRALFAATMLALPLHAQVFRDSAGVRIVENTQPAWGDRYQLRMAAQPDLVIGNNPDSLYRFRQVRGVMRLTDGRIAVLRALEALVDSIARAAEVANSR